ncbi:MAG TPA: disulfide bond formation protein B [Alphaproteobacteria bacterium]|nr:disulfide bond formation protein B [Alphaproteobacteria bacterium]
MCIKQLKKISSQKMLAILLLICAAVVATAYIMEHYFGILGCPLCHYERDIFMGAGAISLLCLVLLPQRFQYYAIVILGFVFMGGAFLAAYHVAVQQHWLSLPSFCASNDFSGLDSIEALKEKLLSTPFVRCDQITWSLFGLSLAVYNTLISLFLALLCWAWGYKRK